MISIVILTLNEASNLPRCLASVAWSDDVVVVDSGSTDATVEVARELEARVMMRPFDSFAGQRNHAMEHAGLRYQWVFHLDADEVVTDALRDELLALARASATPFPVYRVPSRIIFMGRWLKHAGMYPAYQVRFGRSDALRFVDHGHGQREVQPSGEVGTLANPLDHYNFSRGVSEWFARHLRYAAREAVLMQAERAQPLHARELFAADPSLRRRALKRLAGRLPLRPWLRFAYAGILRGGFRDGVAGWRYARMLAIYQHFIDLNYLELRAVPNAGGASTRNQEHPRT